MKAITRELNLELGRPTAVEALRRLEAELEAARHMNTPLLKLIHGTVPPAMAAHPHRQPKVSAGPAGEGAHRRCGAGGTVYHLR